VKHLNPRQGITTSAIIAWIDSATVMGQCETPKSPPGDYNLVHFRPPCLSFPFSSSVKHLNPRQGITTSNRFSCVVSRFPTGGVKHLNPRQGITTFASMGHLMGRNGTVCVKHLNPRQGITTVARETTGSSPMDPEGVKHLNPRQGITTGEQGQHPLPRAEVECETPKSPPGDYNLQ